MRRDKVAQRRGCDSRRRTSRTPASTVSATRTTRSRPVPHKARSPGDPRKEEGLQNDGEVKNRQVDAGRRRGGVGGASPRRSARRRPPTEAVYHVPGHDAVFNHTHSSLGQMLVPAGPSDEPRWHDSEDRQKPHPMVPTHAEQLDTRDLHRKESKHDEYVQLALITRRARPAPRICHGSPNSASPNLRSPNRTAPGRRDRPQTPREPCQRPSNTALDTHQ
jgi:hypothetical protein